MDKFRTRNWTWGLLMAMTIATVTLLAVGMFGHNLYRSNWYFYGSLTMVIGLILRNDLLTESEVDKHAA